MIQLTNEQQVALDEILHFIDNYNPKVKNKLVLSGYAGTGKSTIISHLIQINEEFQKIKEDKKQIAIITYTWKASLVLKQKGIKQASSIHSFLYHAQYDIEKQTYHFYKKNKSELQAKYKVIFIDEASMVSDEIAKDLIELEIPLIFVGDPFQLPPISKDVEKENLLNSADIKLTSILRQALDNPIIELSMRIRETPYFKFPLGNYNGLDKIFVMQKNKLRPEWMKSADQILCGLNKTRLNLIGIYRQLNNINPLKMPTKNEKLIILTNNRDKMLFNGCQVCTLKDYSKFNFQEFNKKIEIHNEIDDKKQHIKVQFPDYNPPIVKNKKYSKEDPINVSFGSVITVHKAQGSAWNKVLIFNEPLGDSEEAKRKWMYVALTRTIEKCVILI